MGLRTKLFAHCYDRMMASTEAAGLADVRREVLRDATGDVLEIGAGTGTNLRHYADDDRSIGLTLTEPDPAMLRRLRSSTDHDPRVRALVAASADDLPFDAGSFDTVVSTLVLCSVGDQHRALTEIRRVLRPGGTLRFVEHVRSSDAGVARRQDRWNRVNRFVVGCECNRPTLDAIERAGFSVDRIARGELPKSPGFLSPMISGRAQPAATP